jgi:hypothetical protein
MAVQNLDGYVKLAAGATITPGLLVKADGTLQNGASTTKTHVGVSIENADSGQLTTLINPAGKVVKLKTNAAIAVGAAVYYDANGTIGTTAASNTQIGVAIDAASGAGSLIEVSCV